MKKAIFASALLLTLAGCAALAPRPPKEVTLQTTFNPANVAWFNTQGTGEITGQAFVQTRGGNPRTCAGNKVGLFPQSAYGDERLTAIYGNASHGFLPIGSQGTKFTPDSDAYHKTMKETTCDAQGNFAFTHLPAGNYFIITGVAWSTRGGVSPDQGGGLMQSVTLKSGETKHVIITP